MMTIPRGNVSKVMAHYEKKGKRSPLHEKVGAVWERF